MKPRLIALTGPLVGKTIDLPGARTSLGRGDTSDVDVPDDLVSRPHCLIVRTGEACSVRDLESHNQTYVNGQPVAEQQLRNGDQIQIGASIFAFIVGEQADMPVLQVYLDDDAPTEDDKTLSLPMAETYYLQSERPAGAMQPSRTARDLEVLFEVSRVLSRNRAFNDLRERLMEVILEAVPAEAGAILLDPYGPRDSRDFSSVFIREVEETARPFRFSRTVVRQVLEQNAAILCNEVATDDQLRNVESLQVADVRSLLAVPIPDGEGVAGIIYTGSKQPSAFDEGDLHLLAGISGIVAAPLENARRLEWWESESRRERNEEIDHNILGESEAIGRVREAIGKVADTNATVLILGETGVGKELVARAIHRSSPRSSREFVDVNCASFKRELVEVDLFGSEPGAFTDAVKRKGKLEVADGGTLFLDEVGELEPRAQAALLRVLETGRFQRVGGTATIEVDVRIVAATNVRLDEAIRTGAFREDLFHRLNVFPIEVPPLRERREDVLELAAYFVKRAATRHKRPVEGLGAEARSSILHHEWPGNIRQLQNAMEYAVISAGSHTIGVEDLPGELIVGNPAAGVKIPKLHEAVNEAKRRIILDTLRSTRGKVADAARIFGIHPNNLHRLIKELRLKPEVDRIREKGTSA